MNEERRSTALELFKDRAEEARRLYSESLKATAIFTAVVGALLKFAYDEKSTEDLRLIMTMFGILISILGFLSCLLGLKVAKSLAADIKHFADLLEERVIKSNLIILRYLACILAAYTFCIIAGWCTLLFLQLWVK